MNSRSLHAFDKLGVTARFCGARLPLLLFAIIAYVLFVDARLSLAFLQMNPQNCGKAWSAFPDNPWLDAGRASTEVGTG